MFFYGVTAGGLNVYILILGDYIYGINVGIIALCIV